MEAFKEAFATGMLNADILCGPLLVVTIFMVHENGHQERWHMEGRAAERETGGSLPEGLRILGAL